MSIIYGNFQQMMGLGGLGQEPVSDADQRMRYYMELGRDIAVRKANESLMAAQQQAALSAQMMGQQPPTVGGSDNSLQLGNTLLSMGFDPNWLSQRLSAGSANGAKIGGMTSGGGGGGEDYVPSEHPEDRIAGKERLQGGFGAKFKDFFGVGANNRFGFGR